MFYEFLIRPSAAAIAVAIMSVPSIQQKPVTVDIAYSNNHFVTSQTKTIDVLYLKNAALGGLNGAYLGQYGPIGDSMKVNFQDNLENMWATKERRFDVTPATLKNKQKVLDRYAADPSITNVKDFVEDINQAIKRGYRGIDWKGYCNRRDMSKKECKTLKKIASKMRGKHIAAYGMTELFPSHSGNFNYVFLDTLLRNAGENYIHSIPAMGDKYLSLGFYQFTSFAIRHDDLRIEGASMVSHYSKAKIPGSVVSLEKDDHHLAAYYFAIHNLSILVKKTNGKISSRCDMDQIGQYVATAHHNPKWASTYATSWIQEKCKQPLINYLGPKLTVYAKKSKSNLEALDKNIG